MACSPSTRHASDERRVKGNMASNSSKRLQRLKVRPGSVGSRFVANRYSIIRRVTLPLAECASLRLYQVLREHHILRRYVIHRRARRFEHPLCAVGVGNLHTTKNHLNMLRRILQPRWPWIIPHRTPRPAPRAPFRSILPRSFLLVIHRLHMSSIAHSSHRFSIHYTTNSPHLVQQQAVIFAHSPWPPRRAMLSH